MVHETLLSTDKDISDLKIFAFSNLSFHKDYDLEKLNIIEDEIEAYQPDYIFYMGKLFDEGEVSNLSYYNLCAFFYTISRIAPVVLSINNVDARSDSQQRVISKLEEFDRVQIINNTTLCIGELIIMGVDLSIYDAYDQKKLLQYYKNLYYHGCFSFYEVALAYIPDIGKKQALRCGVFKDKDLFLFENDKAKDREFPSLSEITVKKRIRK